MITAYKWHSIARTTTIGASTGIRVEFGESYRILLTTSIDWGNAVISVQNSNLSNTIVASVRLRQNGIHYYLDLKVSQSFSTDFKIELYDNTYWEESSGVSDLAGATLCIIDDINSINTPSSYGGSFFQEDENGDLVPIPKADGTPRGIWTNSFMSSGGRNTTNPGGGGGISSFIIKLGEDEYALENNVVSLPPYPSVPDVSGYLTENKANKTFFPKVGGDIEGDANVIGKLSMGTLVIPNAEGIVGEYTLEVGLLGAGADTPEGGGGTADFSQIKVYDTNGVLLGNGSSSGKITLVPYPTIPTTLKNPYALTFGSKTYDGSVARTITADDLGVLSVNGGVIKGSITPDTNAKYNLGATDKRWGEIYTYRGFFKGAITLDGTESSTVASINYTRETANYITIPTASGSSLNICVGEPAIANAALTISASKTVTLRGETILRGDTYLSDSSSNNDSSTSNKLFFLRRTKEDNYVDYGIYAQTTKGLTIFGYKEGAAITDLAYINGSGDFYTSGNITTPNELRMGTLYLPDVDGKSTTYKFYVGNLGSGAATPEGGSGGADVSSIVVYDANGVKLGSGNSDGNIVIAAYPTSLPASDVSPWAKAEKKPSYAFSEITSKPTTLDKYGITDALPLSGGIVKGVNPYHQHILTINTDNTILADFSIQLAGTTKSRIGYSNSTTLSGYRYGTFLFSNVATSSIGIKDDGTPYYNDYTLIHSGNIKDYNAGSATKLQTARTIWGQSFDGTANVSGDLSLNNNAISWLNDSSNYSIQIKNDGHAYYKAYYGHHFYGSGAERMRIVNNGNVLIGTTSDNGAKLQVEGDVSVSDTSGNPYVKLTNGTYTGYMQLRSTGEVAFGKSASLSVVVTQDGTINTNGSIIPNSTTYNLGSSANYWDMIYTDKINTGSGKALKIYTDGTERLRLNAAGTSFYPYIGDNIVGLGTEANRWSNVYSNAGNFASAITLSGTTAATSAIYFSRESGNYIVVPTTGNFRIAAGATSGAATALVIYGNDKRAEFSGNISASGNIYLQDTTGTSSTSYKLWFLRRTSTDDYSDYGIYAQSTKGLTFCKNNQGTNTDIAWLDGNGNFTAKGIQLPTDAPSNPVSGGYYLYVGTLGAGATIS